MALSIDTIFTPLNDFFTTKFGAVPQVQVIFRFDKIGSVISDADFIDEAHGGTGVSPALAIEKFSDLVNRVPVESGDGRSVLLTQNSIDDTYFYRLLSPAVGYVPPGLKDEDARALTNTFNAIKAKAVQLWTKVDMESLTGLMVAYKPSLAMPEAWYDSSRTDVWTSQRFEITQPAGQVTTTPADATLWKLAPSADILATVVGPELLVPVGAQPPPGEPDPPDLAAWLQEIRNSPDLQVALVGQEMVTTPRQEVSPTVDLTQVVSPELPAARTAQPSVNRAAAVQLNELDTTGLDTPVLADTFAADQPVARAEMVALPAETEFDRQVGALDVRDRLLLEGIIDSHVPTETAQTDSIEVTFDYCVVDVSRPWMFDVFLNGGNWYVPGMGAGALSKPDTPGAMTLLPIAVVVIRNLVITANWAAGDIAHSADATAFGPFKIDGGIVDGCLTHRSIQTIGWMLQALSPLPPYQES